MDSMWETTREVMVELLIGRLKGMRQGAVNAPRGLLWREVWDHSRILGHSRRHKRRDLGKYCLFAFCFPAWATSVVYNLGQTILEIPVHKIIDEPPLDQCSALEEGMEKGKYASKGKTQFQWSLKSMFQSLELIIKYLFESRHTSNSRLAFFQSGQCYLVTWEKGNQNNETGRVIQVLGTRGKQLCS